REDEEQRHDREQPERGSVRAAPLSRTTTRECVGRRGHRRAHSATRVPSGASLSWMSANGEFTGSFRIAKGGSVDNPIGRRRGAPPTECTRFAAEPGCPPGYCTGARGPL